MSNKEVKNINKQTKKKKSDSIFSFSGKRFRNGSFSAAMILFAIAIVIVLNLIVSKMPTKYTEFDMTDNSMYSLGEESKNLLKNLDKEVTLYYLIYEKAKDQYPAITKLLEEYDAASDKVTLEIKDPELYPNFGDQYEATDSTVLIVECGERYKLVNYEEIYSITNYEDAYYYGATAEYEFNGENLIANAVNYVVTEDLPKIYILEGNEEVELDDNIKKLITDANIDVEEITLLSEGSVPEDADCVIMLSPKQDITKEEATTMIDYLKAGGNAIISTDFYSTDQKYPNFYSVLEEYGVEVQEGIVYEGNSKYTLQNDPGCIFPDLKSLDVSLNLVSSNLSIMLPYSQGLKEMEEKRETLNVAALLTTTEEGFLKKDPANSSAQKEDEDESGTFNLAVTVTDSEETESEEETGEIITKMVIFGSSSIVDPSIYSGVTAGDVRLFLEAVGWMCDAQDSIDIAAKSTTEESITISDYYVNILMGIFVIGIPVVVITSGILVNVKRRKR